MELRKLVSELISISAIHRYRITKAASSVGLYFGQPMILEYVLQHDACTQKELAEAMHISAASIAVTIKRIEKAGLIVRTPDETDSRKNHLSITEKGKEAFMEFRKICDATDEAMFRDFTPEERETLHKLLARLHQNLDSEKLTKEEINRVLNKEAFDND